MGGIGHPIVDGLSIIILTTTETHEIHEMCAISKKNMQKQTFAIKEFLILAIGAALALGAYLLVSQGTYRSGFPLDDAWIHQTYARNLALRGEWAFLPGRPSAGSTAPLWSLLLAVGYGVGLAPLAWTYLLGWGALTGLAWMGGRFGQRVLVFPRPNLSPGPSPEGTGSRRTSPQPSPQGKGEERRSRQQKSQKSALPLLTPPPSLQGKGAGGIGSFVPWLALFLAGEWHLVWAAGSGMETALYAFLILSVFWLLARERIPAFGVGLACGLAVWVRPDALTLMGPVVFVLVLTRGSWKAGLRAVVWAVAGLGVGLIPYLLFNRWIGGAWWPNTFYAKQAEYAITLQQPLLSRLGRLAGLPLIGAGLLLLPGAVYAVWQGWKRRQWVTLAAALWWAGYTAIYALALPVDYQHGRYLIPAMPVFFVLGWVGSVGLLGRLSASPRQRLTLFAGRLLLGLIWAAFLVQGAVAYAGDVAIIETEMVPVARWLAENTSPEALIAAHDIGAIGYFSGRNVLDLAGLISPEVIPFIRDEAQLAAYLDRRGAAYLVTFPGWYPRLVIGRERVYQSGGLFSPDAGGENMVVYRWGMGP
jgi:hypothetical protein